MAGSTVSPSDFVGAVRAPVLPWLRLEALAALALGVLLYRQQQGSWGVFALAFLLPDLAMLGYLASPRAGAFAYNAAHSYVLPVALLLIGRVAAPAGSAVLVQAAAIWIAHIGFDRALGYGLKYPSAFAHTHLGVLPGGRRAAATHAA